MGDLLGVSVQELVDVLKKKHARLPFEIGAFVALETCEALLSGPAKVGPSDVRVAEDGSVSLFAPPNSATGEEAARSVVTILAHVLVAAGPGVPPVLLDLVEHGPSDGRWDLGRLRDELEASLVPLNRQAARRVLSRMLREARREGTGQRRLGPDAAPDDVDAELDALIGIDGGEDGDGGAGDVPAPPPAAGSPPEPAPEVAAAPGPVGSAALGDRVWDAEPSPAASQPFDEEAPTAEREAPPPKGRPPSLADSDMRTLERENPVAASDDWDVSTRRERPGDAGVRPAGRREPIPAPEEAAPAPAAAPRRSERDKPTHVIGRGEVDLSGIEELGPRRGRALMWGLLFLVLIGALIGVVAYFRPDAVDRFLGREAPEDLAAARLEEERRRAQAELNADHARRFGDLVVRASPSRAQVLLFVGRGPAVAEGLPPGVAHEFIAIADGREPTRAVVPKDAEWDATDEGPRYELAMQAGEAEMTFESLDLGETRLPRDVGTPGAELGSVRVVTNPRGAKVYQLVGFAPNVRIENLRTDEPVELLVWHEGHAPSRVVVGPSDWRDTDEGRVAEVDVQLEERSD